jgi:cytoskeletal protein CcmA (bactofilin family)
MPNTIRVKRRALGGSIGAPSSLLNAELAFNESDESLYIGVGTGGEGGSATVILPIGGPGSFITRGTSQSVSGDKTFSGTVTIDGTTKVNNIEIYGGNLTSNSAIVNLFLAATSLNLSANTGTTTINNDLLVKGDYEILGSIEVGEDFTLNGNLQVDENVLISGNTTLTGDLAVNGGDLTTNSSSFNFITTANNITFGSSTSTSVIQSANTSLSGDLNVSGNTALVGSLIVGGDLSVEGTLTTINSTVVSVDDKNLELGSTDTPTDNTADGGGLTLKGDTDKTIIWDIINSNWSSSEHWNLASGKTFKIDNANVLSSDTLGSGVLYSSLTTLGTITTGVWKATTLTANNGGTGFSSYAIGDILYANATGTLAKLPIGTLDQILQVNSSGVPSWTSVIDCGDF